MRLSLIGFMGSGKSTVGALIARRLSIAYYETDQLIEKDVKMSISDIFRHRGEIFFREQEIAMAKKLSVENSCLISTGGGIVQNKIAIDYMKMNRGVVIYLATTWDEIISRIQYDKADQRPLFQDIDKARSLYHLRLPLYEAYADYVIHTDHKNPSEIGAEAITLIQMTPS